MILSMTEKRTVSKVVSHDFYGTKMNLKLSCTNKMKLIAEAIMLDNWTRRISCKSLKVSTLKCLVIHNFDREEWKKIKMLYPLLIFTRVQKVHINNDYISCTCEFRSRCSIDYPHFYLIVTMLKTSLNQTMTT